MRNTFIRWLLALAAAFVVVPVQAQVHGAAHIGLHSGRHWHPHHRHHGFWGGVGLGVILWPDVERDRRVPVDEDWAPVVNAPPGPPEPVITPQRGQSVDQMEADRRGCDHEAMTQAQAMADAAVFHRSTLACMERRGYGVSSAR